MSPEPCPNILRVYICLNVWWHPAGIRPVPVCSCQRRARNALPERNCPNTSPSAVSPLSCQDEITSHGFIYLFYRAPDRHLTLALSCASSPPPFFCPKTRKVLGELLWEPSKGGRGGSKKGLEENTYALLFNHFIFLPAGRTCDPSSCPGTRVVTGGVNVLGRFN